MLFQNHKPARIEIDTDAVSCTSPNVSGRLARIADNYLQLDLLLTELETRMPASDSEVSGGRLEVTVPEPDKSGFQPTQPR